MGNVLRGDLGVSLISRIPVRSLIARAWPVSVELCLLSLLIAMIIGIPLGVVTATAKPLTERTLMTSVLVAQSVPSFVSGILMILVFSVKLHWLPSSGYVSFIDNPIQNLKVMIMPALSLGLVIAALLARFTRSCMLDALGADFVRTARAKGLKELTVLIRHAFRSALIPVVSLLGSQIVWFLGGAIIQEIVFVLPGLGRAVVRSVMGRDFATIQAVVLLMAAVAAIANLLVDVVYGLLDPRIRYN
jgi:peptide/nickel transport system permease protein